MKMIYITCNVSVQDEVLELLENCNIQDFQVIRNVIARNKKGAPRYDNPVWPGLNSIIMMQVREEKKVQETLEELRNYNRKVLSEDELLTVCTWDIRDYFFE